MPKARAPDGVKEVKADLRSVFGSAGFLTSSQIAEYLGCNRENARKFIRRKGLRPLDGYERNCRYYIDDVAAAIWEGRIA